MLQVFAIASNALLVQGRKLEEIAAAVASAGATRAGNETLPSEAGASVRIGALPVGDPVAPMVTLKQAELAYKMNAAAIATADEMLDSLLAAVGRDDT